MVNLKVFCKQLSEDLGMVDNPIEEESAGIFVLPIEEEVAIRMLSTPAGFTIQSTLATCPLENQDIFFTEVLDSNLYGFATRNNILGLTADGKSLTLSKVIDYNIDYVKFSEILQDFYNTALFWREMTLNNLKI